MMPAVPRSGPVGRMILVTRLVTDVRMLAHDRLCAPRQAACPFIDP